MSLVNDNGIATPINYLVQREDVAVIRGGGGRVESEETGKRKRSTERKTRRKKKKNGDIKEKNE